MGRTPFSVVALFLLLGGLLAGGPARADDITCDGDPAPLTAGSPLSIALPGQPAPVSGPGPAYIGFNGCLRYKSPDPAVTRYSGQITLIFFRDDGRFVGAAGQPLVLAGQTSDQGMPIPVSRDDDRIGHRFGAAFPVDFELNYMRLSHNALMEVVITDCLSTDTGVCQGKTRSFLWSGDFVAESKTPASPGGVAPVRVPISCGDVASDMKMREGVIPAGAFMRMTQKPSGLTTISLIGCLRFKLPEDSNATYWSGGVGAVFVGQDGTLLAQANTQPRPVGQSAPIFPGTLTGVTIGGAPGTSPLGASRYGIHVYGFDYDFPHILPEDLVPEVSLVVTLRSCSANDQQSCGGVTKTWLREIHPCFIGRAPKNETYRGECLPVRD